MRKRSIEMMYLMHSIDRKVLVIFNQPIADGIHVLFSLY